MSTPPGDVLGEMTFRLSYADCDPAGIVYYAAYLPWAERLHSEWWFDRSLRIDQHRSLLGASLVTRHVECAYTRAPTVYDELRAQLVLEAIGHTSYQLGCRFRRVDDEVDVAHLRLTMVFIDHDRSPTSIPARARQALRCVGPGG